MAYSPVLISKDDVGSRREALERSHDGPIPPHLLETRTAVELKAYRHRAAIRFSEIRLKDFSESLERLLAGADFIGRDAWIDRTRATLADHRATIAEHQEALARLQEETADVRHAAE